MKNNGFDLKFRSQVTDLKRRQKYAVKELQSLVLKAVLVADSSSTLTTSALSRLNRLPYECQLQELKPNTLTRVRNRCVISGRSSTLSLFRLSRISFREQAGLGKLIGISKRLNK